MPAPVAAEDPTITLDYSSPDEAPEALRQFLQEDEGGVFRARITPADRYKEQKAKTDEMRNSSIQRAKRAEELEKKLAQYDGIEPEQYRKDYEELRKLKDQVQAAEVGIDPERLTKLVDEKVQSERATLRNQKEAAERKTQEAEERAAQAESMVNRLAIMHEVESATSQIPGFVPHAKKHAIRDIQELATVKDGQVVFLDSEGGILPGPDGKNPKTVLDQLRELIAKEAPMWVYANVNGGGATGSTTQNGTVVLSRADAKDPAKYRAAKERAEKSGSALTIQ